MKRGASPSKGASKKSSSTRGAKGGQKTPVGKTSPSVGKSSPGVGKLSPSTSAGKISPGGKMSPSPTRGGSRIPGPVKKPSPAVSEPDIREESEPAVEETYREEPLVETGRSGIRYITEDLCKKIANEESVENITKLNLTLAREGGKKIKFIENLERLRRLQVLCLSCNVIEKIEKLDKLTKLKELNLSFNNISTVTGLETLTSLQILNLTGNNIERIPGWIGKKLKSLRVFRIAKNRIESLSEVTKLRPLVDLVQLTISENPISQLPHCRLYTIFYLRTVEMLDGQPVTDEEREAASNRFGQEEVENLSKQLEGTEEKVSALQEDLDKTRSDKKTVEDKETGLRERRKDDRQQLEALRRELETKDDLLRKKTSELTKACEKHYELEQELAFYKIDHKFDSLGKPPPAEGGDDSGEGLIGESPYIGRARYKKNEYAHEMGRGAQPQQAKMYGSAYSPGAPGGAMQYTPGSPYRGALYAGGDGDDEIDAESMEQDASRAGDDTAQRTLVHEVLDTELESKQHAIERAQDRLQKLQSELQQTEEQVMQATEEFNKIAAASPIKLLNDEDKAEIREKMVRKMEILKQLKDEVSKKQDEMTQTEVEMRDEQLDVDRLRDKLKRMDSKDSLFKHITAQVADKEAQISFNNQLYEDTQQQLDSMIARIAKETADIKRLEQQLREGQAAQNDELKAELEGIIAGLQDYLVNVRKQADIQKQDYNDMLRQKEALVRKLQEMEGEMTILETESSGYKQLQQRLSELEDTLQNQEYLNSTLQQQLLESPGPDPVLDDKLDAAEMEVERLKSELKETRKRLKAEKEEANFELDEQRHRISELEDHISGEDSKEDQIQDLSQRLVELEAENDNLRHEMREQDSQIKDAMSESIAPDELNHRLRDIVRSVEQGKPFMPAYGENDATTKALAELQRYLEDHSGQTKQELERSMRIQADMENQIRNLKDQLLQASTPARRSTTGVQADLNHSDAEVNTEELKRMQKEIWRLRDALKDMTPIQPTRRGPLSFNLSPGKRNNGASFFSDPDDTETDVSHRGVIPRSAIRPSRIDESDSDRQHHELYEPLDSEEQVLFDEVSKELCELKQQMETADHLTNQQLLDAQNRMAEVEADLKRKESALNKEKQQRAKMESERLQKAMDDLVDAQDEIGQLQQLLEQKEQEFEEVAKGQEVEHQTMDVQKEEIDYLHDVLGAQKQEITHLHDVIEGLLQRKPGKDHDKEVSKLRKEVDRMRGALTQPGSMMGLPPQQFAGDAFQTPYQAAPGVPVAPQQMQGVPPSQVIMSSQPGRVYNTPYQPGSATWTSHPPGPLPAGVVPPNTTLIQAGAPMPGSPPHPSVSFRTSGAVPQPQFTSYMPGMPGQVQQGGMPGQGQQTRSNGGQTISELAGVRDGEEILFCNVPEHHDLEDLIAALQDKIKNLKKQLRKRERMLVETEAQGTRAVQMLTEELESKRDELESLEFSIERQKVSLKQLKESAGKVESEKDAALKVLNELKAENEKRSKRRDFLDGRGKVDVEDADYDYNYDPRSLQSRHSYLSDEVTCMEETLAKRKAELRESEKQLKSCEDDLLKAKNEAKDTIDRYDHARNNHDSTREDTAELERRAHEAGTTVVRCNEEIKNLQTEIAELEGIKHELERTVEDINQVIGAKDDEFKSLDIHVKEASRNLNRMLKDYGVTEDKEREKLDNMKHVEQEVAQRYAELDRLRMQIDAERLEMEQVDKEMGRMKTEHQMLKDSVEEKDLELRSLERDIEKEIGLKQKDIKELRCMIDQLQEEKSHYSTLIMDEKDELHKIKMEAEHEEASLHTLTSSIGKHKAELKHVLEMLQMETTELNRINEQHRQRMHSLEKTQTMLTEEKEDLDKLQTERKRRQVDLDHIREVLDNEKMSMERLETEKRALETNITVMTKEKEMLDETCTSLENKTGMLKRTQMQLEDSIHNNKSKLNKVESELTRSQIELDEVKAERQTLQEDVQILSQHVTDGKNELRSMRENIKVAEDHIHQLEQEMKIKAREKETMTTEVYRLEQEIQQRKAMVEEWTRQEKQKRDDMDNVGRDMDRITRDCNEAKKALHKVSKELEKEEGKLSRVISNAHLELENLKTDLALKQDELEESMAKVNQLKREAEQKQYTKERLVELEQTLKEREREISSGNDEKQQLAQALNRSYKELQTLRDDVTQDKEANQEQTELFEQEVEDLRSQLHDTVKELKQTRKKATSDVNDLEQIAQDHCARANRLSDELNSVRQEYLNLKQQLITQTEIIARDRRIEDTVKDLKTDIHTELSYSMHDLEKSRTDAIDELQELHDQKSQIQHTLDDLKENLSGGHGPLGDFPAAHNEEWRKTAFKDKFAQEQDYLRQQLRQQMSRHEDALLNERQKSEGTLQSLKRRLSNLQDVLSNSDLTRSRMSMRTRSPLTEITLDEPTSDLSAMSPLSSPGKHSYMMTRPHGRSRSWDRIPERGPTSPSSSYYSVA
ncbi:centriolin-like [Lineus longissimus]|uniref:centriolin-like n=1 Tax=Lineus longissimus TaxID=88925 RepID=UPI002B4F4ECC